MDIFFEKTFENMRMPVVVCENKPLFPIIFANMSARITFNPLITILHPDEGTTYLSELVHFESPMVIDSMQRNVLLLDAVTGLKAGVYNMDGELLPVQISGSVVGLSEKEYVVLYITPDQEEDPFSLNASNGLLAMVYHIAYHTADADEAMNMILQLAGDYLGVSRVYIYEDTGEDITENTYGWSAPGAPPTQGEYRYLEKSRYSYDEIVAGGLLVSDDISTLLQRDQDILRPQNVKSIAVMAVYSEDKPVGFLGVDECREAKVWKESEIHVLKGVSNVVSSLISRRNISRIAAQTLEILQTITDNTDTLIYVREIDSYEVVFTNKHLAGALGASTEELLGTPCWKSIRGENGPCSDCPHSELVDEAGIIPGAKHAWEFYDSRYKKWFLANASIIKWIDGRYVHLETAIDITLQKSHEDQLRVIASTDKMTGVYNRQWGFKMIQSALEEAASIADAEPVNLCFIDIDGLKHTNDTFGHNTGDEMIQTIAGALKSNIRRSDMICRWGGDEFLVLLRCAPDIADRLMKKAQSDLEEINNTGGRPYKLSFSYGIVDISANPDLSVDTLVSKADNLMYKQKTEKYLEKGIRGR